MTPIYLDHNATTPLHPEVIRIMESALHDFGNPSSQHSYGQRAKENIETARDHLAQAIQAKSDQILFTSSGTEANNHVLYHVYFQGLETGEPAHIITSSIEHSCILNTCQWLEKKGVSVTYLPVDQTGEVDLKALTAAIRPETKLISIMAANNEVGTIQPLKAIHDIAQKNGIPLHIDAIQVLGKIPFSINAPEVDFATFSAHKLNGPKGAGALYAKNPKTLSSLLKGGPQERQKRAGTENTLTIIGFGECIKQKMATLNQDMAHINTLSQTLLTGLHKIPNAVINTPLNKAIPGTISVAFPGHQAERLVMKLDLEGIYVSTGSACSTGTIETSHVLQAMQLTLPIQESTIRISIGPSNTQEEIEKVLERLATLK